MSDGLPTVWPAEPHTWAKHAILESYLKAWAPIMAHSSTQKIRFVDAFAGPGVYAGGEDGSPILAIKAAISHRHEFPMPIHCLFVEKDDARHECLKSVLARYRQQIAQSPNISVDPPVLGDCNIVLNGLLNQHDESGEAFGPALLFLDQFGYTDVPMSLIARVLKHARCEVFSYLNYAGLTRFLSDPAKDAGRTDAFGSNAWRHARTLQSAERESFLLQLYKKNLREIGGAKFVWDFAMADDLGRPLYWLFFCTNSLRGLEEMKKAMSRVDQSGNFRFSDRCDPSQLQLLGLYGDDWLANHLTQELAGQTKTTGEVWEYVLTETPCHKYGKAMQSLVAQKKVTIVGKDRKRQRIAFTRETTVRVRFADRRLFPN